MSIHSVATRDVQSNYASGRQFRGVPMVLDGASLKFRHNSVDIPPVSTGRFLLKKNEPEDEVSSMSDAFKEVLRTYDGEKSNTSKSPSDDTNTGGLLSRTDSLLISNDNARPKSRSKFLLNSPSLPTAAGSELWKQPLEKTVVHAEDSTNLSTELNGNAVKLFSDVKPPLHENPETTYNISNLNLHLKKGKKHKKRVKSSVKGKKNKQGRISAPISSFHHDRDKRQSVPSLTSPNFRTTNPRVSSEPPSKTLHPNTTPLTLQNNQHCVNKLSSNCAVSSSNKQISRDTLPASASTCKTNISSISSTGHPHSAHYSHGKLGAHTTAIINNLNFEDALLTKPVVMIHKIDANPRVKSSHSVRSEYHGSDRFDATDTDVNKDVSGVSIELNRTGCNLPQMNIQGSAVTQSNLKNANMVVSSDQLADREATLRAIYSKVHQTADRVAAHLEDLKKVRKIYLSDKQSGSIKENGMEVPCAPPATPTPDVLRKYDFVPSMSDIRSQRAVKSRLQVMEKDAQKKKEKKRDAMAKQEKQQSKDRERILKLKQRREIYALNKIMTELEYKRFLEFCQSKGLNQTT